MKLRCGTMTTGSSPSDSIRMCKFFIIFQSNFLYMNNINDEYCSVCRLEVVALVLCRWLRWSFRVMNSIL